MTQTAVKGRDTFRQILSLRTEVEHAALDMGRRAAMARDALSLLYRRPIVSAADLERALGVSTPTANTLIKALIERHVLVEITGQQRGRVYAFERYLKLFTS